MIFPISEPPTCGACGGRSPSRRQQESLPRFGGDGARDAQESGGAAGQFDLIGSGSEELQRERERE